jgi:hypothetical protein
MEKKNLGVHNSITREYSVERIEVIIKNGIFSLRIHAG